MRSARSAGGARPTVARPRSVRLHTSFTADLAEQVRWLVDHRSAEQVDRLRSTLGLLRRRLGSNPGLGQQLERRGSISLRLTPVGGGLPYLVWYYYDEARASAPVWLAMLRHERQDRAALDPWPVD